MWSRSAPGTWLPSSRMIGHLFQHDLSLAFRENDNCEKIREYTDMVKDVASVAASVHLPGARVFAGALHPCPGAG